MSDDKATEQELSALHATVAATLKKQLESKMTLMNADGEEEEVSMATPQTLNAAIKFLKDNNITATVEVGDDLNSVADMLKDKPQRGRSQLRSVNPKKAAGEP